MENSARGRVRASSAIVSPVVTFQLMIGEQYLIGPSDWDVFRKIPGFSFLTLDLLKCIKDTTLGCARSCGVAGVAPYLIRHRQSPPVNITPLRPSYLSSHHSGGSSKDSKACYLYHSVARSGAPAKGAAQTSGYANPS